MESHERVVICPFKRSKSCPTTCEFYSGNDERQSNLILPVRGFKRERMLRQVLDTAQLHIHAMVQARLEIITTAKKFKELFGIDLSPEKESYCERIGPSPKAISESLN